MIKEEIIKNILNHLYNDVSIIFGFNSESLNPIYRTSIEDTLELHTKLVNFNGDNPLCFDITNIDIKDKSYDFFRRNRETTSELYERINKGTFLVSSIAKPETIPVLQYNNKYYYVCLQFAYIISPSLYLCNDPELYSYIVMYDFKNNKKTLLKLNYDSNNQDYHLDIYHALINEFEDSIKDESSKYVMNYNVDYDRDFSPILYNINYDWEGFNKDGISPVKYVYDENKKIITKKSTLKDVYKDKRNSDILKWIQENNIPIDEFGNIVGNENWTLFKMKFSN